MHIEQINLHEGLLNATLISYIRDTSIEHASSILHPAILICPGGAYISITEKEAEPVALKFLCSGYQAFVLRYSIGAGVAQFPTPVLDVAKALFIIRENAKRWSIDPDKITLCGFSTGGHLAAAFASSWQDDYLSKAFNVDHNFVKPNTLILGYPVLDLFQLQRKHSQEDSSMKPIIEMMFTAIFGTVNPSKNQINEWNAIYRITEQMPPTFLWITSEDALVDVDGNLEFIKALADNSIPYEFHAFEKGAHGLSLGDHTVGYTKEDAKGHENASKWVGFALKWLDNH